ncbi:MAG: NUDIX hydrolase [Candidatus Hodarchaeales archaeon]|jgi:ADP-ribose pyrophosphatase
MNKAHYIETISKQKVYLGEIHTEKHKLANNKTYNYEVYHLPPFAIIIPYNKNLNQYLMIRQYRPSWRRVSLEFPAGGFDKSDGTLIETAKRELQEETGFKPLNMREIGIFKHSSRSTRDFGIFYTDSMIEDEKNLDDGEFIEEMLWLTKDQIETAIDKQEIIDGSHLLGWYSFLSKKSNEKAFIL